MKNAIILHGTLGSTEGNWFKWLKAKLEDKDLQVWLPNLPSADRPSLKEWVDYVRDNCPFAIGEDTLLAGHSSGAILALILAQQSKSPVGAVVAVSVFHDNSLNWEPNSHLFDVPFDWAAIQKNAKKLLFLHSDNDPYVPLDQALFVADNCQSEMIVAPGQGHFNLEQSKDYKQFPEFMNLLMEKEIV